MFIVELRSTGQPGAAVPTWSVKILAKERMKRKKSVRKAAGAIAIADANRYLRYFTERNDEIVETVQSLVEIESPSDVKQAVDRLGAVLASRFGALGGKITVHRQQKSGNHLQVDFTSQSGGKPILLLGHLDTVYPMGTLSKMPCRIAEGRLWGPGALDMKSGIALILHAIEARFKLNENRQSRPVTVLLVSDEEVGSEASRKITERLARKSVAVLVAEPAFGISGAVKTARKGVGEYEIKITGKAAHSGLDFEKGASAVLELAKQITTISEMVDLKRGITLNAGIIRGGTRTNVIAANASAAVDVRVPKMNAAIVIERKLRALRPFNPNCQIEVTGGLNRPPMERNVGVSLLFQKASYLAKELGWKLEEAAVGGGSDGNFTAAMGIPTLDGLGGVGEGAHAPHESILISELPRRAALLARLIETI